MLKMMTTIATVAEKTDACKAKRFKRAAIFQADKPAAKKAHWALSGGSRGPRAKCHRARGVRVAKSSRALYMSQWTSETRMLIQTH